MTLTSSEMRSERITLLVCENKLTYRVLQACIVCMMPTIENWDYKVIAEAAKMLYVLFIPTIIPYNLF